MEVMRPAEGLEGVGEVVIITVRFGRPGGGIGGRGMVDGVLSRKVLQVGRISQVGRGSDRVLSV